MYFFSCNFFHNQDYVNHKYIFVYNVDVRLSNAVLGNSVLYKHTLVKNGFKWLQIGLFSSPVLGILVL